MKTLKTLTLIAIAVVTLTAMSNNANAQTAQTETEVVTLTANLNTTLALTVDANEVIFNFNSMANYTDGVGAGDDITLTGDVESTSDWQLTVEANGPTLIHQGDNNYTIPINQIGLWADMDGTSAGNTSDPISSIVPLTEAAITLFTTEVDESNAGTSAANEFTVYWQMGTKAGSMNQTSLFAANYRRGQYKQTVDFVLTEIFTNATNGI